MDKTVDRTKIGSVSTSVQEPPTNESLKSDTKADETVLINCKKFHLKFRNYHNGESDWRDIIMV